jgi:hypothetical protein
VHSPQSDRHLLTSTFQYEFAIDFLFAQDDLPFISFVALTFPHFAALCITPQHLASPSKAVRLNEALSAKARLLCGSEGCAFPESETGRRSAVVRGVFQEKAVVEHKAQTHFDGFALLSHLLCAGYPAAHMYL